MSTPTILLTDNQLDDLADRIAKRLAGGPGDRRKPVTFAEAAKMLGVSTRTVIRRVDEGLIRRVPHTSKPLIPQSEIERLLS